MSGTNEPKTYDGQPSTQRSDQIVLVWSSKVDTRVFWHRDTQAAGQAPADRCRTHASRTEHLRCRDCWPSVNLLVTLSPASQHGVFSSADWARPSLAADTAKLFASSSYITSVVAEYQRNLTELPLYRLDSSHARLRAASHRCHTDQSECGNS